MDFTSFKPGPLSDSAFSVPNDCDEDPEEEQALDSTRGLQAQQKRRQAKALAALAQAAALLPSGPLLGSAAAAARQAAQEQQERALSSSSILLDSARLAAHASVDALIASWDDKATGFRLSHNRFSSWLPWEFEGVMLGRRPTNTNKFKVGAGVQGGHPTCRTACIQLRSVSVKHARMSMAEWDKSPFAIVCSDACISLSDIPCCL
jgi:hypothetical protein